MWMSALLFKILNMSLTAGIVIVLVLIARLLLKKAPKIFSYTLWAVVLFRLVCPVSFSSQFSLMGLFPAPASTAGSSAYSSISYIPSDIVHAPSPQADLPLPGAAGTENDALPQGGAQASADPLQGWIAAAAFLWLSGIALMLIYSAVSLIRLRGKLVGAVWLRDNIYLADHIASPFVIGLFRPKIYLPSTLREEEQSYVLLHEQTHIRRLDHVFKILAFLALAVHWFNPLVWAAFVFAVKDMEMSCDERVLKQMGGEIKGAYGASLFSLATGRRHINGSPLAFGEGDIKGRIKNVMNFKKPAAWVVVISVLAVIIAAICLLANPIKNLESPNASLQDIDISPFTYVFTSRIVESPGKQHAVQITIYKDAEDSDSTYIMGNIGSLDDRKGYTKDSRTIFWQKADSNSIEDKTVDGETLDNWIEVAWLDEQNININGISLNINNVYDYRRDQSTLSAANSENTTGKSESFDYGGLHLQATNVSNVRTESTVDEGGTGTREYTVFVCNPGAVVKVLDADMSDPAYSEDGKAHPEWAVATTASELSGERIYIVDGMDPFEITPDTLGIYDPESSAYVLRFEIAGVFKANVAAAYVDETLSETEARALQSRIEQNPNVEYADFVTREEAMKIFEDKYTDKSLFENIDSSAFRHRYYIYIRDISLAE
ncbi:Signal transducer regulating beta-lactamase production, contains metallopeptidase domain [Sporobacter termitidis DSM 10068]|uniref:Signal transducer regulating beta-lactamase production, contains metallopeptidase domain n=1 Tax=Sporobacter termitidis DSM 10068 TaxID=1123282 RepID=A0A1M5X5H7_9FIRM|nr:permease-like cell division protein FtsX [Sporobacter termitidis]SHH95077.1 Signal transducer regulating beta-lactamase production, contains metallopeptidase domain [Sporobacter termitidis DSM 10068]